MSDTFMADSSMIPALPADSMPTHFDGIGQPQSPNPTQANHFGVPKFYYKKKRVKNEDGSVSFTHAEWCDIITPGDPKSTPSQKVTDWHRNMWPREYAAFKQGEEMARSGWPIDMWSYLNESQVHSLKALNVYTVEDIANMSDTNLRNIPMGRTLKNQAVAALRAKKEQDGVEAYRQREEEHRAQMDKLESDNLALQAQLADVLSKLEDMGKDEDAPKKRGRPAKSE